MGDGRPSVLFQQEKQPGKSVAATLCCPVLLADSAVLLQQAEAGGVHEESFLICGEMVEAGRSLAADGCLRGWIAAEMRKKMHTKASRDFKSLLQKRILQQQFRHVSTGLIEGHR